MDELIQSAGPVPAAVWDGNSFALKRDNEITLAAPQEEETVLDLLAAEDVAPERVYWPMEQLLARYFSLPLAEPRLLDAAILSQELEELSGEEGEQWWLTWHAGKDDDGVTGLVFGLPQALRRDMQERGAWQNCPQLLVDGWERLQAQFQAGLQAGLQESGESEESCAVIDEDSDGVFFGLIRGGVWRGMRRLNRRLAPESLLDDESLAVQISRSWKAMGLDSESGRVIGRAGSSLAAALQPSFSRWEVVQQEQLPDRLHANLELIEDPVSGLNFRHGKWAVRKKWPGLARWKRPLAMASSLLLIWMVAATVQLFMLDRQAAEYQASVEAAFHRGLPGETVMLDPMAQLRRAAGSSAKSGGNYDLLHQLQLLSSVWRDNHWQISEFNFDGSTMQMSGSASDIDSLNRIRDRLGKESGRNVVISDTDLSGNKVSFRMKW